MKYLFMPIWFILVCLYTFTGVGLVILFNVVSVLWHLNINHTIDWEYMTEEETYGYYPAGYDRTP